MVTFQEERGVQLGRRIQGALKYWPCSISKLTDSYHSVSPLQCRLHMRQHYPDINIDLCIFQIIYNVMFAL